MTDEERAKKLRELDAQVAVKVFGFTLDYEFEDVVGPYGPCAKECSDLDNEFGIVPNYATDMSDAWAVIAKLEENVEFNRWVLISHPHRGCTAKAYSNDLKQEVSVGWAIEMPEAICRAALEAVKGERKATLDELTVQAQELGMGY